MKRTGEIARRSLVALSVYCSTAAFASAGGASYCDEPETVVLRASAATFIATDGGFEDDTNYDSSSFVSIYYDDLDRFEHRSLFDFDLSMLADSIISVSEIELHLEVYGSGPDAPFEQLVYRPTEPWDEGSVTWNTRPSAAFVRSINIPATLGWVSLGDFASLVSSWVNYDLPPRHGFELRVNPLVDVSAAARFANEDHPTNAPRMTVTYCAPPETVSVPVVRNEVVVDGHCSDAEYLGSFRAYYNSSVGIPAEFYLHRDDEFLYLCSEAITRSPYGRYGLAFDNDLGREAVADVEDLLFEVGTSGVSWSYSGTGVSAAPWTTSTFSGWTAGGSSTVLPGFDSIELQIPVALLGADLVGMAFHQKSTILPGDYYGWPRRENPDSPATWTVLDLGVFLDGFESGDTTAWSTP